MAKYLAKEKNFSTKPIKVRESKNQNYLLLNVPGDGNCLITSTFLGYFGNFHYDFEKFISEVEKFFPELPETVASYEELYYHFNNLEQPSSLELLKPWLLTFRQKIAQYIFDNKDEKFSLETRIPFSNQIKEELKSHKIKLKKEIKIIYEELKKFETNESTSTENKIVSNQIESLKNQLKIAEKKLINISDHRDLVDFYVQQLKVDKTWCGSIEIEAIADLTNCDIHVEADYGVHVYASIKKDDTKKDIVLNFVNNNHYNCYIPNFVQEDRVNNLVILANQLESLDDNYHDNKFDSEQYNINQLRLENERLSILEKISEDDHEYAQWLQKKYDTEWEEAYACSQ